ncbi:UNVERIFIED_CONTAM: hypothetical protein FKN15_004380 [Acipenser sinensis]
MMLPEWQCSDQEKRKQLVDSLKHPAPELASALRASCPDAPVTAYLEILEKKYSTADTGEDLYFKFKGLKQNSGEKVPDFLLHLEKLLLNVASGGGMEKK